MSNIFFISDTHFGHANTFEKFKRNDGRPLRPFTSVDEMNGVMIKNWNAVVAPSDKIYHLGDVVINKKYLWIVSLLNGHKRLIRGNHDIFDTKKYLEIGFEEVYGTRVFEGEQMIFSHIPLYKECITTRFGTNVHGHLHSNVLYDIKYLCISVEHTKYAPISLNEIRERIESNKKNGRVTDYSEVDYGKY